MGHHHGFRQHFQPTLCCRQAALAAPGAEDVGGQRLGVAQLQRVINEGAACSREA